MGAVSSRDSNLHPDIRMLYSEHHSWLQNWLWHRVGCRSDAADLAQDTFMRMLRTTISVGPQNIHEPRAYLATIARRLMLNMYRRRSVENAWLQALKQLPDQFAPSAEEQFLILEALQAIDSLLHGLPSTTRRVFMLSQLEGHTYAEIATMVGVTVRTVQRHVTKAMEQCMMLAMEEER